MFADLDSFKDSNSDLMSTAEEGHDEPDRPQPARTAPTQPLQPPPAQQAPGSRQQRQRASQTDMPEQHRPAIVSPLKVGRRPVVRLGLRRPRESGAGCGSVTSEPEAGVSGSDGARSVVARSGTVTEVSGATSPSPSLTQSPR